MISREMSVFANIDSGRAYLPSHLASNLIELNFTPLPLNAQAKIQIAVEVQVEKRLVHIHLVPIKKRCKGSNYFPPNAVSQETS